MNDSADNETPPREEPKHAKRRALLVADEGADAQALKGRLVSTGLEVESASVEEAARRAAESTPAVVVLAFGAREGEERLVTLARRLRAEPASFALPLVFTFRENGRTLRSAAQHAGADDYLPQDAPVEELRARLDALFWRIESGRRSAPAVAEQRNEIDNFIFLLDSVGADARAGATGSVALVETDDGGDAVEAPRAITRAHSFLKLNLRRLDAVAFYGPETLLVYMPNASGSVARSTLARLREEFSEARSGRRLFAGVSSFPAQGSEVEVLVEQAEAALTNARGQNSQSPVVVYGEEALTVSPPDDERRSAVEPTRDSSRPAWARETAGDLKAARAAGSEPDGAGSASTRGVAERRTGARADRLMLVISDAARMAQINLLLRSEGFEVRAAFDGQHALNLLRIDRPDVLVVDYEMPGMDGAEMLRRLSKQSRAGQSPPTLVLVPAGREDVRAEALAAGARSLVELPYDPVEFLDALRAAGRAV
jgi:PleD family two-component response regulator